MTAAQAFALKAESIGGWTVERAKAPGVRSVQVRRQDAETGNGEMFSFTWRHKSETDNYVFDHGEHIVTGGMFEVVEDWSNLAAALRIMREPGFLRFNTHDDTGAYFRLPFDIHVTDDFEVIEQVRGRRIDWHNRIAGFTDTAVVPHESKHTALSGHGATRVLTFASYDGGFRSVTLASITNVGGMTSTPRSKK